MSAPVPQEAPLLDRFLDQAEAAMTAPYTFQEGDELRLQFTVLMEITVQPAQFLAGGPQMRRARLRQYLQNQVREAFALDRQPRVVMRPREKGSI